MLEKWAIKVFKFMIFFYNLSLDTVEKNISVWDKK